MEKEYKLLRFIASTGDVIGWIATILATMATITVFISFASADFAHAFYTESLLDDKARVIAILLVLYGIGIAFRFLGQIFEVMLTAVDEVMAVKFHLAEKLGDPHADIKALRERLDEKLQYNQEYLQTMGESLVQAYSENGELISGLNDYVKASSQKQTKESKELADLIGKVTKENQLRLTTILEILENALTDEDEPESEQLVIDEDFTESTTSEEIVEEHDEESETGAPQDVIIY